MVPFPIKQNFAYFPTPNKVLCQAVIIEELKFIHAILNVKHHVVQYMYHYLR